MPSYENFKPLEKKTDIDSIKEREPKSDKVGFLLRTFQFATPEEEKRMQDAFVGDDNVIFNSVYTNGKRTGFSIKFLADNAINNASREELLKEEMEIGRKIEKILGGGYQRPTFSPEKAILPREGYKLHYLLINPSRIDDFKKGFPFSEKNIREIDKVSGKVVFEMIDTNDKEQKDNQNRIIENMKKNFGYNAGEGIAS